MKNQLIIGIHGYAQAQLLIEYTSRNLQPCHEDQHGSPQKNNIIQKLKNQTTITENHSNKNNRQP
ncbi:hypothetical protein [Parazoarcus communis]|uniref:hypothetical protein n=1 Tax=Parazoarcus communis TaxID=41977 RepID=UPI001403CA70|nr:hypothetical protein [Parazoarcus communis]